MSPPLSRNTLSIGSFSDPRIQLLTFGYRLLPPLRWRHEQLARPFWRFYWNARPGASLRAGDREYPLQPDTYLLLAPHTAVSTHNEVEVEHFFIHFQALAGHIDPTPRVLPLPASPLLDALRERVVEHFTHAPSSQLKLSLYLRALIEACLGLLEIQDAPPACQDVRIVRALDYIEEHLQRPLGNEEVAREIGMSASTFNRHFRREMGHSFHEYLQIRRVDRACLLLAHSPASIEQVAEEAGFCDRFYFSRVFKAVQGLSPGAYRRLHQ